MRGELRNHWRDPRYWRWMWESRVSGDTKGALALMVAVVCAIGGYLAAQRLAATHEVATVTTQRTVTVVRKTSANAPPEVVTRSQTVTRPDQTDVVTVRRDGRTVTLRAPGETVTVRGSVQQRVVTNGRTDTVVRTETQDRLTTVTTPATTETVTYDVTQPAHTVTETATVTETDALVVVTVTEVVTVTVTETDD